MKVPNPEVVAQLEMTQAELEAMRKQLLTMSNHRAELQGDVQRLQGEVADATWQLEKSEATREEVERQLGEEIEELRAQLEAAPSGVRETARDCVCVCVCVVLEPGC